MYIPEDFTGRLEREFSGRQRIRWSPARQAYQIESRIGRAAEFFATEGDDNAIRLRDGYQLVAEIVPGESIPCKTCDRQVQVPKLQFAEAQCQLCKRRGLDGRTLAGSWPLGDKLLQHLIRIDPYRNYRKQMVAEMDLRNRRREETRWRDNRNLNDAVSRDYFNRIMGIQQVGFGGSITK